MKWQCVELGGGGTPLFLSFRKECSRFCLWSGDVVQGLTPLVRPITSFVGGIPCRLFYCLWASERDRYALQKLSDPLLLTGARLEEDEWVE